jgi:non-ribosomal peptide synthase protein (TIGR01720 family)
LPEARAEIIKIADVMADSLDFTAGPLFKVVLFRLRKNMPCYFYLLMHHVLADGSTVGMLYEDLMSAYRQLQKQQPVKLPAKTSSVKQITEHISAYATVLDIPTETDYWHSLPWQDLAPLPLDYADSKQHNLISSSRDVVAHLSAAETQVLLLLPKFGNGLNAKEAILAAVAQAVIGWAGGRWMQITSFEAKGDVLFTAEHIDISRTVGWFTLSRLLVLQRSEQDDPLARLRDIRQQIERIPSKGFGPSLLTWGNDNPATRARGHEIEALFSGDIKFNFRGSIDSSGDKGSDWMKPAHELAGQTEAADNSRVGLFFIFATIIDGSLELRWQYSCNIHKPETVQSLLDASMHELRAVVSRCLALQAEQDNAAVQPAEKADINS